MFFGGFAENGQGEVELKGIIREVTLLYQVSAIVKCFFFSQEFTDLLNFIYQPTKCTITGILLHNNYGVLILQYPASPVCARKRGLATVKSLTFEQQLYIFLTISP